MKLLSFFAMFLAAQVVLAQPNYEKYDALLQKYVGKTGNVNYKNLKENAAELRAVTDDFSAQNPSETWGKNERLAFWINSYNAFTLLLITENYPIKSITDLDGGKPWDVKRVKINGQTYSLNQIENEIIRPNFHDPRVHFALNCGAVSCPPLFNRAFRPENLNQQLEKRTRQFVRSKNSSLAENSVKISKIFEWYKVDFQDLVAFLNKYSTVKISPQASIEFLEYDWNLNQ